MKKLGFGCMRLPMEKTGENEESRVDLKHFSRMVDTFLENGFNYFDTARIYLEGKSETALKECLAKRYPRESYLLADKLTASLFEKEEDILPLFAKQLESTGVEYFDYYLMHALTDAYYKKFTECNAFEIAKKLKLEGKIKHVAMSFHDKAEVLEKILSEHPEIEVVQIQFNYVDYDNPSIDSKKNYEVCRKFNKPIIIMEPMKGGILANPPEDAKKIFDKLGGGTYASYANRYAASFPGVMLILSGMSTHEQLEDNISHMSEFIPLTTEEFAAIDEVRKIFKNQNLIACTDCRYCVTSCPQNILIPNLFSCMNSKSQFEGWQNKFYYGIHTANNGKASECIHCQQCEPTCPQHLPISDLMNDVALAFEGE